MLAMLLSLLGGIFALSSGGAEARQVDPTSPPTPVTDPSDTNDDGSPVDDEAPTLEDVTTGSDEGTGTGGDTDSDTSDTGSDETTGEDDTDSSSSTSDEDTSTDGSETSGSDDTDTSGGGSSDDADDATSTSDTGGSDDEDAGSDGGDAGSGSDGSSDSSSGSDTTDTKVPEVDDKVEEDTPDPTTESNYEASVTAGRVAQLELNSDSGIADIQIIQGPEYGNLVVNPDNTLGLVLSMSDQTSDLTFQAIVTHNDGTVEQINADLNVEPGSQDGGWGLGEYYKLATDDTDTSIIETGDIHQEVYVSASDDALSLEDIAALEGTTVEDMNFRFLLEHPVYGSSPEMALDQEAGAKLFSLLTKFNGTTKTSHHFLLENGYEYGDLGTFIERDVGGESELHPLVISSWGEGEQATITSAVSLSTIDTDNIVFKDLTFEGGIVGTGGTNILFDNVYVTKQGFGLSYMDRVTVRNSEFVDVIRDETADGSDTWSPHLNRSSGLYADRTESLLLENLLVDHSGWAEDYERDLSADGGQPPSLYSQNIYINYVNNDVTMRDTITMRAASYGAQVRSGGFMEDNLILDNNAGISALSSLGTHETPISNYSLFSGNVVTSGAHKTTDVGAQGGLTIGINHEGFDTTMVGNIVAHLADPNNPDDLESKYWGHPASQGIDPLYDDTIIYNWVGVHNYERMDEFNKNVDGLDTNLLDQTTIQLFTADLLGQETATIDDFAEYLRAQAFGSDLDTYVDADLVIAFFREGFGVDVDIRVDPDLLTFIPNVMGEGVRWDNRLNWDSEDVPMDGDNINLNGNWVNFHGTTEVGKLYLGDGGTLNVGNGRLTVSDELIVQESGGDLTIDLAGQVVLDGYSDDDTLTISADGGRFMNEGLVDGSIDMTVTDNAQVLLAVDEAAYYVGEGSSLTVTGGDSKVGFDGAEGGTATLLLDEAGVLSLVAEAGHMGSIEEFRSGYFGEETTDVQSGVNLGDSSLHLDISDLEETVSVNLISADEIIGSFGDIEINGLGSNRDATVEINYTTDTVTLVLGAAGAGSGTVSQELIGDMDDAQSAAELWAALTSQHGVYSETPTNASMDEDQLELEAN